MKTIKIILGIVSALVIMFLLTGMVITEVAYTAEIEIDKTIYAEATEFDDWLEEFAG